MRSFVATLVALASVAITGSAWAHGGGLNKDGCHTNRKTGDYHCHRGGSTPPSPRSSYVPANSVSPSGSTSGSHAFANCTEARAAGAAPVHRGDPGYGPHLDRDNDGVGCEPSRGRR
ncbi:excalibur calcium-binding domain-containing protein [Xanthomonas bonasiae]|uniref:excalibur calcium-binding domain-containing protein n=1 Tax=Xanthomonas bonasiae TaxID=2810351 RepID=UPI0031BAEBA9